MKITDWCILISMLGICFLLPLDIQAACLSQAFYKQTEYEKILDRICEDSLIDAVSSEKEQGEIQIDTEEVYQRFDELLTLEFGVFSEWERQQLLHSIRLKQFENLNQSLSMEQTEQMREKWESVIAMHEGSKERHPIALCFPYISGEDWYQNLAGPSLYSFFDPDRKKNLSDLYHRYVFSGSRILKQAPETEYGVAQSGSSIQKLP